MVGGGSEVRKTVIFILEYFLLDPVRKPSEHRSVEEKKTFSKKQPKHLVLLFFGWVVRTRSTHVSSYMTYLTPKII